jgi:uncharacterized membrane protein
VGFLLGWGSVGDSALVATIMDLARRGHIELRREMRTRDRLILPDKTEEVLVMRAVSHPGVEWEEDVMDLLFTKAGSGSEVTDEQLKDWVKSHRQSAYSWWQSWMGDIKADGKRRHWIEPMWWMGASVVIGAALIGLGVLGLAVLRAAWPLAVLAIVGGVGLMALSPLMRRRSPHGRVLHHRWERFGAFLRDFSLMEERSPEMLTLWGRYLVYAVPLGVADEVMRNLDARLSDIERQQVGGGWYPFSPVYGRGFSDGFARLSVAIPAAAISSSPSSSSGGGGGFSGGGGGGGGGSGGGAF